MASEDSDQLGSGFSTVHRFHDLKQVRKPVRSQVMAAGHLLHTVGELVEVQALSGPLRVFPEERDNDPKKIGAPVDVISEQVLSMIVITGV